MQRILLTFFIALILSGCSSGKKSFEKGNYYEAVMKSINRLRSNPDHKKSKETLKEAYPLALDWLQESADNAVATDSPSKWKNALGSYNKINAMYEGIRKAPGARRVISNPKNFYDKIAELKQKAAKESYNAGITALQKDTREDAKRAYYLFRETNGFVAGYKEVADMIVESKFKATLKVVVEQIPVPTRYRLSADFFQDKVEGYLRSGKAGSEFVRFYTPSEAKSENLPYVDQILKIQFDDFVVGKEFVKAETESLTKDSVKVGEVKLKDGTKKPVFGTVKAKITTYKKELKSEGRVSMQILDGRSNGVLKHEKFNGKYIWTSRWGSYNGDSRALSDEQLKICERKEKSPPPNQDMFIKFTEPIYRQLTSKLRSEYSRY